MAGDNKLLIENHDGSLSMSLYAWSEKDEDAIEALEGIVGFGFPDAQPRWFEGAGHGSSFRGSRTPARDLIVPFTAEAKNRAKLQDKMSKLARILDPDGGREARLRFMLADTEMWFLDVVRQGGGQWARIKDSDNRTFVNGELRLRAGNPFFARERPETFVVTESADATLLPYVARLRLVSSTAFGSFEVENVGDAPSFPDWELHGPFGSTLLRGPQMEILRFIGPVAAGEVIHIDSLNNLVTDQNGVNRYDGIDDDPEFWRIDPGLSTVYVEMTDIDENSSVIANYRPRRWLVI